MAERFTWDERKATSNLRRHGVAIETAIKTFRDPFAIERIDEREAYGEERIDMLGMCDSVIPFVI
ncbi:BrnT family toxin [Methylobacterium currus]|uniref:BrnT family toxin n=1 Tax=Methylobacterium currus TaxID=2051553 RepID=UPI001FD0789C|nr:BrnT family toxin [Methylobacterium currus]